MPDPDGTAHVYSARIPHDIFEALKAYAFFSRTSMNDVVVRAIRAYLVARADDPEVASAVDAARRLREQLDRWREA